MEVVSMMKDELRQEIFDANSDRLIEKAQRAVNVLGMLPKDVVVVAIHVDDPEWTDLANKLVPGEDWQRFRDRGELPIARGSASWGVAEYIQHVCPDVAIAIEAGPPEGHLFAFVMAAGGVSVFAVPYSGMAA
jgi:hypothetical protein